MKRRAFRGLLVVFAAGLVGCTVFGGQTGQEDESAPCESIDGKMGEPIALDADSGIGLTPQDMLDRVAGPHAGTLSWYRTGDTTMVELRLVSAGAPERLSSASPLACPPVIRVPIELRATTEDGQLDEPLEMELEAIGPETVTARGSVSLTRLAGTWDARAHDLELSTWAAPELTFRFVFEPDGGLSGFVWLDGGDPNPNDSASPLSASVAEIYAP